MEWAPIAFIAALASFISTAYGIESTAIIPAPSREITAVIHYAGPRRVSGTKYCVDSVNGNDSHSGSCTAPWKTVSKVESILSQLRPGDRVLFKGGEVWTEQFNIDGATGSPARPIIFSSYGVARPILDEQGRNKYCIDAIGTKAKYLIFDNFECRHATQRGVTFQTNDGTMPGIVVSNFYIHNTGPGCFRSNTACVGFDDNNYANQLDFEDFGQRADGVRFVNNIVKWCGGHNCLQVHHDTGSVLVQGNVVGPGCVHTCLDVKGIGSPSTPAAVRFNIVTCGASVGLCGCEVERTCLKAQNPAYYTENVASPNETVTYCGNIAYDTGVGFQDCPGGCTNKTGCGMDVKYYNNTAYIPRGIPNSYGFYAETTCNGLPASGPQRITLRNNIFDGASNYGGVYVGNGFTSISEDYNNIGGVQSSPGFMVNGSSIKGPHDLSNLNPHFANPARHGYQLHAGSPCIDAGSPSPNFRPACYLETDAGNCREGVQ